MNKKELKKVLGFICVGLIVSVAIASYRLNWFSNETSLSQEELQNPDVDKIVINEKKIKIQPISEDDHILGNPNAPIKIITYSDFECDFCADMFYNMDQILELYGGNGKIAWVYRHFPINQQPESIGMQLSLTSECLISSTENSNQIFWDFSRNIFSTKYSSSNEIDMEQILSPLDFSQNKFNECMSDNNSLDKVAEDIADGLKLAKEDSSFGTPYNIIYLPDGNHQTFSGVIGYEKLKNIVESIN